MDNANELRIGNLVYKHFEDGEGEIEIVTSRTIFDCQTNPTGKFSYTGIPLTPELLEKYGFTKQKYEEWDAIAYKDTPICCYWDGVEYVFRYGFDSDLSFAACQYLHQVQNLIFALTGEELIPSTTTLNK